MKILSIDTATNICSVAVLENDKLIKELKVNDLKNHSEKLMPTINEILNDTNISLNDIELIVCDKGPGSFTGIRIGIATTMAICDSLYIKSIGISSLEALTYNEKNDGYICSLIDANNDNIYFSLFEIKNNSRTQIEDFKFQTIDEAIKILKKYNQTITFVGDGFLNYKEKIQLSLNNCIFSNNNELNAYSLGLAGYNHYLSNQFSNLLPLYLRKSQAERQLEEKQNGNNNN